MTAQTAEARPAHPTEETADSAGTVTGAEAEFLAALDPEATRRLAALEERVREDLATTAPKTGWTGVAPRPVDVEVLVVGAGQAGLGTAFALKRQGIGARVVEAGTEEDHGCWSTVARMHTLRSPKHMQGIELDVPSLHVRNWFGAVYGPEAWDRIRLVPRLDWNSYLSWYRRMTEVPVQWSTRVVAVDPPEEPDGPFRVTLAAPDGRQVLTAQRIVFATGLTGGGGLNVPEIVSSLPRQLWAHTDHAIDFAALEGKHVVVVGAGASGYDNAATALEHGAASATVLMRRPAVPSDNPLRWMEFPGMQEYFPDLEDGLKWEFAAYNGGLPQPPTQHAIWRCFAQPGFRLVPAARLERIEADESRASGGADGRPPLDVVVNGEHLPADLVIAATGYTVDLSLRPELGGVLPHILLWEEVHAPAAGHPMGRSPYLGGGFQFLPRDPQADPWVERLHHFSTGARVSMGVTGHQLSGIRGGIGRIAREVASSITRERWPEWMEDFRAFRAPEISSVGPWTPEDGWYPAGPRHRS